MNVAIVPFSIDALDAEERSAADLAAVLGVATPCAWPPEFNDADTRAWFRGRLAANHDAGVWLGYYVVAEIGGQPTVAGTAGFKGPPNADGMVEVGYSIIAAYHRRGIATAAVEHLLARAFADARVSRVVAETLPDLVASRGLLEKCGFVLTGTRIDPEDGDIVIYTIRRSEA